MQNIPNPSHLTSHRLGFGSTRFDGTDEVSLETRKWAQVLERLGQSFFVELLIVENSLSIPMNIPLRRALAELIAETGIPVIEHHHDFFWERKRFLVNCTSD